MSYSPTSRKIPSSTDIATSRFALAMLLLVLAGVSAAAQVTSPAGDLKAHLANLATLDYPIRTNAARMIRRAPAAEAVPLLAEAVRSHKDEFVRYRALVLLTSFNDRNTPDLIGSLLQDRNDRLREVAYKWLEQHPDPRLTQTLLAALQSEKAEFVRPALVAALISPRPL